MMGDAIKIDLDSIVETMQPGRMAPMGAHVRDGGVNFCVFSAHALSIDVCVFDAQGQHERARHALHGPHDQVFHGFLPESGPGLVYGLRAAGRDASDTRERGNAFDPFKVLLDPCAREIVGTFRWPTDEGGARDAAAQALKARVAAAPSGPSPRINAPHHATRNLVLYELHVKGFSRLLPDLPEHLRGTYAGLTHPASIAHFKALGVTTLSLLPVHYAIDEEALAARGLVNYWGYNTLGFFAPNPRYACHPADPTAVNAEFRAMVHTLHAHGLEVVLDVVYNHTAEGDHRGPTLSFRGLDHASWYRLDPTDPTRCENLSGCGNTLNAEHPRVTQFVLDSLRYWVEVMGVDGFRFDLASILGRTHEGFDVQAPFFNAIRQDPLLAQVHLIAEPWDAAVGGYQVGRFPGAFLDWNDQFRDAVRGFWLERDVSRGTLARRFTASNDLFHHGQRQPTASVNFIAVHDGFTLADSVSYNHKHNHANGEANRDGRDHELSHNFGVEGPSDDPAIVATRRRVQRAMLATLLLAQGTPMLGMGDELARTQRGNNNAYNQDNEINWVDWANADRDLMHFVACVLALRRDEPVLRYDRWFDDQPATPDSPRVQWLTPHGPSMHAHDWNDNHAKAFACMLTANARAQPLLLIFNAHPHDVPFALPHLGGAGAAASQWHLLIDASSTLTHDARWHDSVMAPAHSLTVLRHTVAGPPTS